MPLRKIISELQAMQPDMRAMSESLAHYEQNVGYFRPCQLGECVKDALTEAVCIMPQINGITKNGVAA